METRSGDRILIALILVAVVWGDVLRVRVGELILIASITIVVECAVAFAHGCRRRDLLRVAKVNAVSNPAMNVCLVVAAIKGGCTITPWTIAWVEAGVVLVEGAVYRRILEGPGVRPFQLALSANLASYFVGTLLGGA